MGLGPEKIRVEDDQRKLYDLIWKRTLASQMAAARLERTAVDILSPDGQVGFRANGQVVLFDGYLKVYDQGRDDRQDGDEEDEGRLPQVMQGEGLEKGAVTPDQHFTQPPPRYTEATLVKRMEELGIGRPSTYASILTTIVDREYVRKEKNRLYPEDKGRLVTAFLANFFRRMISPRRWKPSSTTSRPGTATTRMCSPASGATSRRRWPRRRTCGSARCWRNWTISSPPIFTRRGPTGATRGSARLAAPGGCI
jgi:DNA topoisomerase IA